MPALEGVRGAQLRIDVAIHFDQENATVPITGDIPAEYRVRTVRDPWLH